MLLAALIGLYLVAGATVFSALESPGEAEARARWGATLRNFSAAHGVAEPELRAFLRHYEAALAAGVRADALRPRWDFPGAFYFVGTVVSTIGERRVPRVFPLCACHSLSFPSIRGWALSDTLCLLLSRSPSPWVSYFPPCIRSERWPK